MRAVNNRQRELAAWMWNNGGAQMTVALAMGVLVLAVIVSVQPGSILKDLIAGFGAVGQVFFAGMVWRLGREQFRFTQTISERQKQIDLLPLRRSVLGDLRENHTNLNRYRITRIAVGKIAGIVQEMDPLFSLKANALAEDYANAGSDLMSAVQAYSIASGGSTNTAKMEQYLAASQRALESAWKSLIVQISREMKLA